MRYSEKFRVLQWLTGSVLMAVVGGTILLKAQALPPAPAIQERTAHKSYKVKVIGVIDGDSLTVRNDNQTIKVRLAQIDAPERGQPWGQKSRQVLSHLINGRTVTITPNGTDRYGRLIANVEANGIDVNKAMVAQGAAWAYPDYVRDQAIFDLEASARAQRRGLWVMSSHEPIAPWDYRKQQRDTPAVMTGR